jgi:hypothetical protein
MRKSLGSNTGVNERERGPALGILDDVKSLAKTVQQIDNVSLYRQILDLQGEILELVEENRSLKQQIAGLQESARIRGQLIVRDDCYWLPQEGGAEDGPFCTNCWDVRQNLVRMWKSGNPDYSTCPNCAKAIKVRRRS